MRQGGWVGGRHLLSIRVLGNIVPDSDRVTVVRTAHPRGPAMGKKYKGYSRVAWHGTVGI